MRAIALYRCSGEDESEMSFNIGDVITQVEMTEDQGWYRGFLNGKQGVFPGNYVRFEEDPVDSDPLQQVPAPITVPVMGPAPFLAQYTPNTQTRPDMVKKTLDAFDTRRQLTQKSMDLANKIKASQSARPEETRQRPPPPIPQPTTQSTPPAVPVAELLSQMEIKPMQYQHSFTPVYPAMGQPMTPNYTPMSQQPKSLNGQSPSLHQTPLVQQSPLASQIQSVSVGQMSIPTNPPKTQPISIPQKKGFSRDINQPQLLQKDSLGVNQNRNAPVNRSISQTNKSNAPPIAKRPSMIAMEQNSTDPMIAHNPFMNQPVMAPKAFNGTQAQPVYPTKPSHLSNGGFNPTNQRQDVNSPTSQRNSIVHPSSQSNSVNATSQRNSVTIPSNGTSDGIEKSAPSFEQARMMFSQESRSSVSKPPPPSKPETLKSPSARRKAPPPIPQRKPSMIDAQSTSTTRDSIIKEQPARNLSGSEQPVRNLNSNEQQMRNLSGRDQSSGPTTAKEPKLPPRPAQYPSQAPIPQDALERYEQAFSQFDIFRKGKLEGKRVREIWLMSELDQRTLGEIWYRTLQ
ncbi:hypothetical protein EDD86DRAFT_211643 [Gorgonomyces haynaldii]|nr:hypothetical protein EDD86DRAFT_211643 [Gorgonomyces haynaldii]